MKIVGLVSCYKEGRLVQGAVDSLKRIDKQFPVIVFEGPAGKIPDGIEEAPESEHITNLIPGLFRTGQWRTDARKRNAMLQQAKEWVTREPDEPLWGVWLDGDEVLRDAEYLRDQLQSIVWQDEQEPEEPPTIRWPLWVVEADGSVALTTGRVVRLDLIRSYDISVSVVTNELGLEEGQGNENPDARLWIEMWQRAMSTGRMLSLPPHPGQPHIVHRSNLRHPLRKGLRMHKQEADELRKAGKL